MYTGGVIADMGLLDEDDLQLLWLPLAHAFGKVLIATQVACGFATAIDGRVDKIVENCGVVKPTFMGAAPRIFEKAYSKIVTQQKGAKAVLFGWAFAVGKEVARRRREGKFVWPHLVLQQRLFDGLVFAKIRDVFGGRIRFFISGSAPLNRDIAEWFEAAGVLILEGYGLTESSGAGFINRPDNYKLGTVGLPFEGTEVRISDAGEVQFRSDCVMAGYHHLDDATAEALKDDGWLSTGDQGKLDDDGFLTITGRIKELFKLSNGKYVAPPAIEAKFATLCPYASQFMVFGEGKQLRRRAGHPGRGLDQRVGQRQRAGRQVLRGPHEIRRGARHDRRARQEAQRQPESVGDDQEVGGARPRPLRRRWPVDTVAEGEAWGCR